MRHRIAYLLHHSVAHAGMGLRAVGLRRVARLGEILHHLTENHAEWDSTGEMEPR